jgi:hypothetical protein
LHEALTRSARENGVSINQFVSATLAGAIGWEARRRDASREEALTGEEAVAEMWRNIGR